MKLRIACLIALLGLIFPAIFPGAVAAAIPTVDLVLGGSGATSWAISGIKPGDSGTQPITILNNGTGAGNLTIWVSNIVNIAGLNPESENGNTAEPGALGDYITFTVVSSRISSNIAMPSLVAALPQSAADSHYIRVLSLAAGETVSLNWNWDLPAATGNDVQGDSLSFTINYALEEFPDTMGNLPLVKPVLPGMSKAVNVWLLPAILAVIGAVVLFFSLFFILISRRRWEWIPYVTPAVAVSVLAQTAEQRSLYGTRHQKRVAELASAIAREMNLFKKLAGNDILLTARILAVAGAVEMMADTVKRTFPKPYRPAMSLDKILEEIKRNSSTLYDSEVIKAFVRLVDRGTFGFQTRYS